MITRSRKKELLLEILYNKEYQQDIFLPESFKEEKKILLNFEKDFLLQDRFCVRMETENFFINPERIKGFKIENLENKKIIKIKTYLHIDDWIKDFEHIQIIKIHFFDSNGNILKNCFDYDVDFMGFSLECDYKFRDYLVPIFTYQILGI